MTLELEDATFGWEAASVPDDLTVRFVTGDAETAVYLSLADVLLAYGRLSRDQPFETVIGSNLLVKHDPAGGTVVLQSRSVQTELSAGAATAELESLLAATFDALDRDAEPERRAEALDLDVEALYRQLSDE